MGRREVKEVRELSEVRELREFSEVRDNYLVLNFPKLPKLLNPPPPTNLALLHIRQSY